jgi:hypothetical protein
MPNYTQDNQFQPPLPRQALDQSTPRRVALFVGDLVRSAIIILGWLLALAAALVAGYLGLRALLFFLNLARTALGL